MAKTSIGSTALHLSTDSTEFEKGLTHAERLFKTFAARQKAEAASLQKDVKGGLGLGDVFKVAGGVAGGIVGGLGLAGGISSLASGFSGLVVDSVKLAASVEDTATDFRVMVGDADRAAKLFGELRDLAGKTPLTTNDLADAGKQLLSVGVAAEDITRTLQVLGDLAGGQGEKLQKVVQIYGQIRTEGKLSGENLKQLGENGIVIVDELARVLGKGKAEVAGLAGESKIGFSDLQKAINLATGEGGRFFGLMEQRSKTFNGLLSSLEDSWDQLRAKFGEMLIDEFGLKDVLEKLAGSTDAAKDNLDGMRPFIHEIADVAKETAMALYEGGWAFAKAMAQAKDAIGDIKATADGGFLNEFKAGTQFFNTIFGSRGSFVNRAAVAVNQAGQIGGAEATVDRLKEQFDKIWNTGGKAFGDKAYSVWGDNAAAFGGAVGKAAAAGLKVERDQLNADQIKQVRSIREELDPTEKIRRELKDLSVIAKRGGFDSKRPGAVGIDADLFNLARAQIVKGGLSFGFDPARAVGPATAGSSDAVSAIINARNGGQFKAEDRLLQAAKIAEAHRRQQIELLKKLAELVAKGKIPGVF